MKKILIFIISFQSTMQAQQHQIGIKLANKTWDEHLINSRFVNKYVYGIEYSYYFKKQNRIFIEANIYNKTISDNRNRCAGCLTGNVNYSNQNFHVGYIYHFINKNISPFIGVGMQAGTYYFKGNYTGILSGSITNYDQKGQLVGANAIIGVQAKFLKHWYCSNTILIGKQELIQSNTQLFNVANTNLIIYQPINLNVGLLF